MEQEQFFIEKKKELIDAFHKMIWDGVRDWQKLILQNILVIAWVGFLIKFGLEYEKGEHFYIAVIVSQVIIGWIILVILEAGYWVMSIILCKKKSF